MLLKAVERLGGFCPNAALYGVLGPLGRGGAHQLELVLRAGRQPTFKAHLDLLLYLVCMGALRAAGGGGEGVQQHKDHSRAVAACVEAIQSNMGLDALPGGPAFAPVDWLKTVNGLVGVAVVLSIETLAALLSALDIATFEGQPLAVESAKWTVNVMFALVSRFKPAISSAPVLSRLAKAVLSRHAASSAAARTALASLES